MTKANLHKSLSTNYFRLALIHKKMRYASIQMEAFMNYEPLPSQKSNATIDGLNWDGSVPFEIYDIQPFQGEIIDVGSPNADF